MRLGTAARPLVSEAVHLQRQRRGLSYSLGSAPGDDFLETRIASQSLSFPATQFGERDSLPGWRSEQLFHKSNRPFGSPVGAHGVGVPSTTIAETAFAIASGFRRSVGPCGARRRLART